MYCKNCGKQIDGSAKFCPYCGTKVDEPVTVISPEIPPATAAEATHIITAEAMTEGTSGAAAAVTAQIGTQALRKKDPGKGKKGIFAVLAMLIVIGIAVFGGLSIHNSPENRLERALELGQKYLTELKYDQAIIEFSLAIEIDPGCAQAYIGRGNAYEGLGESEENLRAALEDYQMALEIDGTLTEVYIKMADIYARQNQNDMVVVILEKGLEETEEDQRIIDRLEDISQGEDPAQAESEEMTGDDGKEGAPGDGTQGDGTPGEATSGDEIQGNVVYANNETELNNALQEGTSDCTILLSGIYHVSTLYLSKLENVTIQGTDGTSLLGESWDDTIMIIDSCKGLTLKTLVLGHDTPAQAACTEGVLDMYGSEISLIDCDIFGCGITGFHAGESTIRVENSVIRDCSESIMGCWGTSVSFEKCTFSKNGYLTPRNCAIEIYDYDEAESMLSFSECVFDGNYNPELLGEENERKATFDHCSFTGNAWD